jgi:L-alanine-DL-glutamate epimerase-like enolase superfamily enzyme
MKITHVKTRILSTPADNRLVTDALGADTPAPWGTREFVTVEVMTDEGVEGIGITFFGAALTKALKAAVDSLGELVVGEDPMRVEKVVAKLRAAASGAGPGGVFTLALSALDMALWDIKGKTLGVSVSQMAGGYRDRAPTYASGALLRQHGLQHLARVGPRLVEMGYRQMKSQMGAEPTPAASAERMRVLREAVGPDIDLMCDINQLWNANQAITVGKRVEQYHLFWLEDVVAADDYQGLAKVADNLTTPIAAGEYVYGITPFRQLLEHRSVDIVMIDLVRVGGITQWLKVAGMAEAFNLPVVSHLIPEVHVQLISAIPNGLTVEYMPWTERFYEELPRMEDGQLIVPDKPGLGLSFDQRALERYTVG